MWNEIWPLILVVVSNTVYHVTAKQTPAKASPFLSLTVTYLVGAVISFAIFLFSSRGRNILQSFGELNWTSFLLGLAIIGLEAGYLYVYRAGWNISVGSLIANAGLAVMLIVVGALFYKEALGWKQIAGILLCLGGLVLINA